MPAKDRKSPTMSATACPGCTRKGNDGRRWRSLPNKNGIHSWRPVQPTAGPKKSPKKKSPKATGKCPQPMLYAEIRPRQAQADPEKELGRYTGFLCSEKLDGWRGIWCKGKLQTKSGKLAFRLPPAWQKLLPDGVVLDGEVYLKGSPPTEVARLRNNPDSPLWRRARYHVFDMPSHTGPFAERVKAYTALVQRLCKSASCPLKAVKQTKITSPTQLLAKYRAILQKGGEGVVITDPHSLYVQKRVGRGVRVKLKGRMDKEGTVVGHNVSGGVLKSLKVKHSKGSVFKLGIGLSAEDRRHYKTRFPRGTRVTYSYLTETKSGHPREARLVGVRHKGQ